MSIKLVREVPGHLFLKEHIMDRKEPRDFVSARDLDAMGAGARRAFYANIGRPDDVTLRPDLRPNKTWRISSERHLIEKSEDRRSAEK